MNEFKQGDRVQTTVGEKGIVVSIKDGTPKVGFDNPNLGYGEIKTDILMCIEPSPAIKDLPEEQRTIILRLHDKLPIEGQQEARNVLVEHGYIVDGSKVQFTPYGRYMTERWIEWIEAGKPVDEPAPVIAAQELPLVLQVGHKKFIRLMDDSTEPALEAQESTPPDAIKQPETGQLNQVLPPDPVSLFAEHDMAKKLAELEAENERLKEANSLYQDAIRIKNDELREMQNIVTGLRADLENARKRIEAQAERLLEKREASELQPVGEMKEIEISTSEPLPFKDMLGVFRTVFQPLKEQSSIGSSEMVIPEISLFETAEDELDAYDYKLAAASIDFIASMRQQRKLQNAS